MALVPFTKPPLSLADQLTKLKSRGLIVNDRAEAERYLKHIGYYRLSGYALPFQNGGEGTDHHDFKNGTTFGDILDRYVFDRKLRLLIMDAVERIEISIHSALSNSVAIRHGAHWYSNPALFQPTFDHASFIQGIKDQIGHDPAKIKKRDTYIKHYYNKYDYPNMPPCWMVFEAISFGTTSIAFKNLAYAEHKPICDDFGLNHQALSSWLHSISYIRNICAHHARLWNRVCTIKPFAAKRFKHDLTPNDRIYAQLVVMQVLLGKIAPGNHWARKIRELLAEHPNVPLGSMGFPSDWESRPLWKDAPMTYAIPLPEPTVIPVADGSLFPVRRVLCVARNYAAHAREMGGDPNREPPFFFSKPTDAVTSAAALPFPSATRNLHHEVELVVAIAKGGANIPAAEALDHVFGYTVGLDLTRRDLQEEAKKAGRPWDMAKGFDLSAPIGVLHPAASIGHPAQGTITLTVNGAPRQHGDLSDMIWSVAEVISHLSGLVALAPGDIIFTGTPEGVGAITPGDRLDAHIDNVADLSVVIG